MNTNPDFMNLIEHRIEGLHITPTVTLRDHFAGQALASTFYPAIMESIRTDVDLDCKKVAEFAYTMADAMMKARK